jgi:hypothetical protein
MTKPEKIVTGIFGSGVFTFAAYCFTEMMSQGFRRDFLYYLERGYFSAFGVILVVSLLGLFAVLVTHIMRNRKNRGKASVTNGDRIWFRLSFVPFMLMLLYGVYSAFFGIDFLWSRTYGIDGFLLAMMFGGIALVVIPVLPLCIVWQIIYIIRRRKEKKAAALQ